MPLATYGNARVSVDLSPNQYRKLSDYVRNKGFTSRSQVLRMALDHYMLCENVAAQSSAARAMAQKQKSEED